jgi:hypothetical protein
MSISSPWTRTVYIDATRDHDTQGRDRDLDISGHASGDVSCVL